MVGTLDLLIRWLESLVDIIDNNNNVIPNGNSVGMNLLWLLIVINGIFKIIIIRL